MKRYINFGLNKNHFVTNGLHTPLYLQDLLTFCERLVVIFLNLGATTGMCHNRMTDSRYLWNWDSLKVKPSNSMFLFFFLVFLLNRLLFDFWNISRKFWFFSFVGTLCRIISRGKVSHQRKMQSEKLQFWPGVVTYSLFSYHVYRWNVWSNSDTAIWE